MSENNEVIEEVFILRGLPGSGKSDFAKALAGDAGDDVICEADAYMYKDGKYDFNPKKLGICHKLCMDKFKRLIHSRESRVIVSNTSTKTREFKEYKKYAEENGYRVTVVIVENRHGNTSIHDVPEESMNAMRERFQIQL